MEVSLCSPISFFLGYRNSGSYFARIATYLVRERESPVTTVLPCVYSVRTAANSAPYLPGFDCRGMGIIAFTPELGN